MTPDQATKKVRFERVQSPVLQELGFNPEAGSKRGNTVCLHCGASVNSDYIKQEGRAGHMGQQLMAVVLTKREEAGKIYIPEDVFSSAIPERAILEGRIQSICTEAELTTPEEHFKDLDTIWISTTDYRFPRCTD